MNYFSKNLKYLRKDIFKLSRGELADKIRVNQSTISRWENSEMGVTVENAYDIATFFKVSMAELIGKDMSKNTEQPKKIDELNDLFCKYRHLLTKDDEDTFKFILNKRKNEKKEENL